MKLVRFHQKENFLRNNKRLVIEDGDDSLHKTHLDDRLKILGHIQHLKEQTVNVRRCTIKYYIEHTLRNG